MLSEARGRAAEEAAGRRRRRRAEEAARRRRGWGAEEASRRRWCCRPPEKTRSGWLGGPDGETACCRGRGSAMAATEDRSEPRSAVDAALLGAPATTNHRPTKSIFRCLLFCPFSLSCLLSPCC